MPHPAGGAGLPAFPGAGERVRGLPVHSFPKPARHHAGAGADENAGAWKGLMTCLSIQLII